jgi:hypothetical protein
MFVFGLARLLTVGYSFLKFYLFHLSAKFTVKVLKEYLGIYSSRHSTVGILARFCNLLKTCKIS